MMQEHGEFSLTSINNIIHVEPKGGFNEYGINKLHQAILAIAPKEGDWALFEHPKNNAGLTPQAAEALLASYQYYAQHHCKVIALEISSTWQGVIEKTIKNKLNIPVYMGESASALTQLITPHIK